MIYTKIVEMKRIYKVTIEVEDRSEIFSDETDEHMKIVEWAEETFGRDTFTYDLEQEVDDYALWTRIDFEFDNQAAAIETKLRWT